MAELQYPTGRLRSIQIPSALDRQKELLGLQTAQRQGRLADMQLNEAQRKEQVNQQIMQALQETGGDIEAALPRIAQIDPTIIPHFQKIVDDQRDTRTQRDITARNVAKDELALRQGQPAEERTVGKPGLWLPPPSAPAGGVASMPAPIPTSFQQEMPVAPTVIPGVNGSPSMAIKPDTKQGLARDAFGALKAKSAVAVQQKRDELAATREANTYTVDIDGKQVTGPKELLDNIMGQAGQDRRASDTMDAAATRHRETMEQRRLDREQRAASARENRTDKPPSAANLRTFGFYMRAADAVETLAGIEKDIKDLGLAGQAWQKFAPNFMQTQLGQTYEQAQRQFTEARLRKDSGAAIPEHEYVNDKRTYFVQPGDTNETLERKRKAREVLISALKNESGRAYTQSFSESESKVETMIHEGYEYTRSSPTAEWKRGKKVP